MKPWAFILAGMALALAPLLPGEVTIPLPGWGVVTDAATSVTYVMEKDDGAVPSGVMAGLNKLNRDHGIVATVLEADATNGGGQVPKQYEGVLAAAKQFGLPCLVVLGHGKVLRVVKAPVTSEDVIDAAGLSTGVDTAS